MATPFDVAGGQKQKQTRYAPIWTNRFFTGLWTQRNPLRDAATPYLYEKFYAGSRFDSLIDGLNMELTNKLTLQRRPGHSVYNSQTFSAINSFYNFRTFVDGAEAIKVIADTSANVYDATGPSTKFNVLTKGSGAGRSYFQGVGDTLYWGDGVEQKKWVLSTKVWHAVTLYNVGDFIVDVNDNLQQISAVNAVSISIQLSNNILTVNTAGTIFTPANAVTFSGFGVAGTTFLNGLTLSILQANSTSFTCNYVHADVPLTAVIGTCAMTTVQGTSGVTLPVFPSTPGATVSDGNMTWTCRGPAVQNWGITPSSVQPLALNTALPVSSLFWVASTWYGSSVGLLIVDSNNNIQKLTTAGTTGAVEPVWNLVTGGVTADNTAAWTNQGPAAWANSTSYTAGQLIQVDYSITIQVPQTVGDGILAFTIGITPNTDFGGPLGNNVIYIPVTTNYSDFFICTSPGTTGMTQPDWRPGQGSTTTDNTVQWQNCGIKLVWATIGAAAKVETATKIIDSNGNFEIVTTTGISGSSHPVWPTTLGGVITETNTNGPSWSNGGPSGNVANTGSWTYAYAPRNTVTGFVGTCSPRSIPVTQGVNSFITVQGNSFSDVQVNKIRIFRTLQGGSTLFFVADIDNPSSGTWNYQDTNPDAALNQFIQGAEANANDPPPLGLINLAYHLNRTWGSVGNITYYSSVQSATTPNPYEAFPPLNSFTWPSKVVRHVPTPIGLLVFTVSDIFLISGQATSTSPLFPSPYIQGIGLGNYYALDINGTIIFLMTTDKQTITLDPTSGVSEVGFPIGDQLANFSPSTSYVSWHVSGSSDKALYVSDNGGNRYRLNPTSAPESGLSWSPKATIAAGASAQQSIEVTPGVHRLLVGPSSSGPILQRDESVFADNAVDYTCNATIGSIVLAHPGQVAAIEFLTTDCMAVGTRPTLKARLDEISGNFETEPQSFPADPPQLPASTTTYADRFYFTNPTPSLCRHMQIDISFPSEAFKNEILAYAIFGAVDQEL